MSAGTLYASLYWSCPAGLPNDWRDRLDTWKQSINVTWLANQVTDDCLRLVDDDGSETIIDLSRGRPTGMVSMAIGPKLVLGILRVAQLLEFSMANELMEKIDLRNLGPMLASGAFEMPYETLEDMAFSIGLAPRAFRLRQIEVAAIRHKNVLF